MDSIQPSSCIRCPPAGTGAPGSVPAMAPVMVLERVLETAPDWALERVPVKVPDWALD